MTAPRKVELELGDIQGGILTAYGKQGFPKARYLLFHVKKSGPGRDFVERLRPLVTTALRWDTPKHKRDKANPMVVRPRCTVNLAFSFWGLYALGVPTRTLRGMPDEFIDGMQMRGPMLGDDVLDNVPKEWDPLWNWDEGKPKPHILVTLNAGADDYGNADPKLEETTQTVLAAAEASGGQVVLLEGHGGPEKRWQELSAIFVDRPDGKKQVSPMEHFGFADAIGDPVFEGQYPDREEDEKCVGQGAVDGEGRWRPLATGEFILGWTDEAQEVAGAAMPLAFSRNGSFFAYRKLHQHVGKWDEWVTRQARGLAVTWCIADPAGAEALLKAKMAGRWPDGVPLSIAPTLESWRAFQAQYTPWSPQWMAKVTSFGFLDDLDGSRCPVTSHIRRANTRDMLDPLWDQTKKARMGSALNNRRRILRRGLPYGSRSTPGEHGIVLLAHCASLFRQFEFVQQQWINYGLDFNAGNDSCPVIGNHPEGSRFVIPAPDDKTPPYIASGIPQFVSTRGGDYFFAPSMTALRMIGQGTVDPT